MKELIVLVICFVLYVTAVEMYENRLTADRNSQLVKQEQSFTYVEPEAPMSGDGSTVTMDSEE